MAAPAPWFMPPSRAAARECSWRELPLSDRVFDGLDRAGLDHLARRLGLEHGGLAREGIHALARLCRRLLDNEELGKARQNEHAVLLELLVAELAKRLQNALDIFAREVLGVRLDEFLNELRLSHQVRHVSLNPSLNGAADRSAALHGCAIEPGCKASTVVAGIRT